MFEPLNEYVADAGGANRGRALAPGHVTPAMLLMFSSRRVTA